MSFRIKAKLREILAQEQGATPKDPGGRLRVALIWPGDYRTGMSALGYLSIYGFLNSRPGVLAERFFAPDGQLAKEYEKAGGPLLSLENARPLSEFDIIAASLSLENDYWRLPQILKLGGLSTRRETRGEHDPIVIAGGVALWANPWPVFPYVDLCLAGEAEAQWPQLISAWKKDSSSSLTKQERLFRISRKTPGSFIPGAVTEPLPPPPREGFRELSLGRPNVEIPLDNTWDERDLLFHTLYLSTPPLGWLGYKTRTDNAWEEQIGAPQKPSGTVFPATLPWPPPDELLPPVSPIISPGAEFANTKLVEISRGCPYGCRFCLAGFIFRPHRPWPLEKVLKALGEPESEGEKVGLVSPAVADYPHLDELLNILFQQKRSVTVSSLRLTALTPELAEKFARGRLFGVAIAPEGGSQRLRDIINKDVNEKQILEGARLLAEAGLRKIKLYFMLGLPNETDEDVSAIVELCRKIREAAKTATSRPDILLSLANFTPKAHTPFENAPMNTEAELRRKGKFILAATKGIPRLEVNLDPPLWSIAQGLLARGGSESAALVEAMLINQGRLKPSLASIAYTPRHPLHRPWPEDRPKPWRIIRPAAGFECLERERTRSEQGLTTAPCPAELGCGRCSACQ